MLIGQEYWAINDHCSFTTASSRISPISALDAVFVAIGVRDYDSNDQDGILSYFGPVGNGMILHQLYAP